jgi:hypothetical protein
MTETETFGKLLMQEREVRRHAKCAFSRRKSGQGVALTEASIGLE